MSSHWSWLLFYLIMIIRFWCNANAFLKNKGLSVLEVMLSLSIFSILSLGIFFSYHGSLKSFHAQLNRTAIRTGSSQAMEIVIKNLRNSKSIDALNASGVTFTADLGGGDETFRIYLYNEDDPEPNPPFTEQKYDLKFIRGSDVYGQGAILAKNIKVPTGSVFSQAGNLITLDWTTLNNGAQIRLRSSVRPRNL